MEPNGDEKGGIWKFTTTTYPIKISDLESYLVFSAVVQNDDESVYIIGGLDSNGNDNGDISRFNVTSGTVEKIGELKQSISSTAAVWAGDSIFVLGGALGVGNGAIGITNQIIRIMPLEFSGTGMTLFKKRYQQESTPAQRCL